MNGTALSPYHHEEHALSEQHHDQHALSPYHHEEHALSEQHIIFGLHLQNIELVKRVNS